MTFVVIDALRAYSIYVKSLLKTGIHSYLVGIKA